jgi:integrase
MTTKTVTVDPYKRFKTATPGLTHRFRADGKKTWYSSSGDSKHVRCATRDEALETLERLRGSKRRGERVVVNSRVTFAELAEQWLETRKTSGRNPLRERTQRYYRSALDLVLVPRFGIWRVTAIDVEAVAQLTRDLEREGLHAIDRKRPVRPLGRSSIENYLKPLQGVLRLAVRRGLVSVNPFDQLVADDRPTENAKKVAHEWTDEELARLLSASEALATQPSSRYDYSSLLKLTARLGLRLGEVLGLQWQDFSYEDGTLKVQRQWTRFGSYGPPKTKAGSGWSTYRMT